MKGFSEIFTFLYYTNEGSDDVTDRSTKTVQHLIKNISGNINKSGVLRTWQQKRKSQKKQNDSCHAIAKTTVMLLALF